MENHLDCPLCQKSISYAGFHKHIFSTAHKDDLEALILKRKQHLLKYVEGKDHSSMPYVIPNLKKSTTSLKLCFGCKKAFVSKSYCKNHTCPHLKEQLERLKIILAKQVVEEISEDESKLKSQNETLKKNLQLVKEDNDKLIDIEQSIINLIKSYKKTSGYDSLIAICQDEQSALYDHIIGYLDDE